MQPERPSRIVSSQAHVRKRVNSILRNVNPVEPFGVAGHLNESFSAAVKAEGLIGTSFGVGSNGESMEGSFMRGQTGRRKRMLDRKSQQLFGTRKDRGSFQRPQNSSTIIQNNITINMSGAPIQPAL